MGIVRTGGAKWTRAANASQNVSTRGADLAPDTPNTPDTLDIKDTLDTPDTSPPTANLRANALMVFR